MKYILYFSVFIASLAGIWSCNEDTYVDPLELTAVRGRVVFSLDQRPARNVAVKLSPSGRLATTDSSGSFRFDSVLAGKYTVQASLAGYGNEVVTIDISKASSPVVTLQLTDDKTQNRAPTAPTLLSPALSSSAVSTTLTLHWKSTDPNRDSLTYDVLLFRSGSTTPSSSFTGLQTDSLQVSLDYNTTYLWQVIVKDGVNTVNGDVWSFRTSSIPDYSYLFAQRLNGQFQIFAANATGSPAQLTHEGSNWRPIVSPNKRQVAFISNVETELQLYVMNVDGSNIRRVSTVPIAGVSAVDLSFSWSPDGTQLLYPNNDRLYAVRTDGTGLRVVAQAATGRLFNGCDWTPQGNRIAARTTSASLYNNEITVFAADGGAATSVFARTANRVGNPVFSVDGRKLLFTMDVSGFQNEQGRQLDSRLFLLDLATADLVDLSLVQGSNQQNQNKPIGTNDLDARFSPNGSQLIFTNADNTGNGLRTVFTSDLNGQNRRQLFTSAEMPYWRQ